MTFPASVASASSRSRVLALRFAGAVFLSVVAIACDKTPPAEPLRSDASSAVSAPVTASAPSASGAAPAAAAPSPSATGSVDLMASIADRLKREQASRPNVAPTADDVFAAFTKAGVKLKEKKQHLGAPMEAMYCAGALTDDDTLAMSVCEYKDVAAGTAGLETSKKAFAAVTTRTVWRNKATTLAIIQMKKTPASDAVEKKLADTFSKL
jgi:hypothetical protein